MWNRAKGVQIWPNLLQPRGPLQPNPVKIFGWKNTHTCLFAFPCEVTKHLALYLYVIRPIAVELLGHLGQDVPYYSSNIWAHVQCPLPCKGANPWIWSGSWVSGLIQTATNKWLGVVLTPMLIQRIESQLFRFILMLRPLDDFIPTNPLTLKLSPKYSPLFLHHTLPSLKFWSLTTESHYVLWMSLVLGNFEIGRAHVWTPVTP